MQSEYWGINHTPFTSGPVGNVYFPSPMHEEALARIQFLIGEQRSCGVLYGPNGSGKSLVLREVRNRVHNNKTDLIIVDAMHQTDTEMLWTLCREFGLGLTRWESPTSMWQRLEEHFEGNRWSSCMTVVLVDHLERTPVPTMAVLERLAQGMCHSRKMLFLGAYRATELKAIPDWLRELAELRIELPWFDRALSSEYIDHLFQAAGGRKAVFQSRAVEHLHRVSGGSPRVLNQLCDLSLLAAMAAEEPQVTEEAVLTAAEDWGMDR